MSKPSFSNIDLWLFELAEGNLSEHQVEELRMFLLQNPDLDVDKDAWEWAKVDKQEFVYPDQNLLVKKSPSRKIAAYSSAALILLLFVGCYEVFLSGNSTAMNESSNTKNQTASVSKVNRNEQVSNGQLQGGSAETKQFGWSSIPLFPVDRFQQQLNNVNGNIYSSLNFNPESGNLITQSANEERKNSNLLASNSEGSDFELYPNDIIGVMSAYQFQRKTDRSVNYSKRSYQGGAHSVSFSQRMKKVGRKLQRMMDNPIALKNFRDPNYHIPGMLPNDVNFSSAGTLLRTRVQTLSRAQWLGAENEQFMNSLSIDGYSRGVRGGWGFQLNHGYYHDGGLNLSEAAFTYSPKFSVNSMVSVEPSIRFKMGNKLLNDNSMLGVQQVETARGNAFDYYQDGTMPVGKSLWYKDIGAGLMVNTKWFFASVQADNLLNHKDNIYSNDVNNPRRVGTEFFATAGTDWESTNEKMKLSPYLIYHKNENLEEMWLGMNYSFNWQKKVDKFNSVSFGASVSTALEPAASIGLKFNKFSLMYHADYTLSAMTDQRKLSHQLSLRFLSKPMRPGKKIMN